MGSIGAHNDVILEQKEKSNVHETRGPGDYARGVHSAC
jgi:hypothetical protein